tara:strand:+ start:2174 stop:2566 length:393 start_codon:yes stop_codon:yes gene_type:complete
MGADFMFAKFPKFTMTDERKQSFRGILDSLEETDMQQMYEWYFFEDETNDQIRSTVLEDIETACDIESRETSIDEQYNSNGEMFHTNITGGMSWGDPVTDAYDSFAKASHFDAIYNLAIDFAVQDCKVGV